MPQGEPKYGYIQCKQCGKDVPIFYKSRVGRTTTCSASCRSRFNRLNKLSGKNEPPLSTCAVCGGPRYYKKPRHCKECHVKYVIDNRSKNHGSSFNYYLKKRYGIDAAEYNRILDSQGGGCAICGDKEKLVVDHDHKTGRIRGILCNDHNLAIGRLGDTYTSVIGVMDYLRPSNGDAEPFIPRL